MNRVLEVFAEPISNGGQESFFMNVLQAIDTSDISIDLLTPYYCDNNYYRKILKEKKSHIYCWNLKFKPGKSRFFYIKLFGKFFHKHNYDVVHIHSGSISALAYIAYAARKAGVKKIIVHSHATGIKNIKHFLIKNIATPIMNYSATDFFACSEVAGEWKFSKRICKDKLKVIKNGVNIDKFSYNESIRNKYRNILDVNKETLLLGHVGRFSYEKNQEFIVEILNELVEEGINVKLLLIGTGETEDKVKKLVENYYLKDSVIFMGNVNNVYDYMQAMDILVLPSRFEGFPVVAIEAQAAGLPIIASNNITKEIKLSNSVVFENLDSPQEWKKRVLQYKNQKRNDNTNLLIAAGYDISATANELKEIYSLNNEIKKLSSDEIKKIELDILLEFKKVCEINDLQFYLCGGTMLGAARHKGFIPWDDDIDICMIRDDYERLIQIYNKNEKLFSSNIELKCFENNTFASPYIKIINNRTKVIDKNYDLEDVDSLWIDVLPVDGLPSDEKEVVKIYKKTAFWRRIMLLSVVKSGVGKNIFKKIFKPIIAKPIAKIIGRKKCTKELIKIGKKYDVNDSEYVGIVTWGLYGPSERMRKSEYLQSVDVEFEGHKFKAMSCWNSYLSNLYGDYMKLPPVEKRISHELEVYLE